MSDFKAKMHQIRFTLGMRLLLRTREEKGTGKGWERGWRIGEEGRVKGSSSQTLTTDFPPSKTWLHHSYADDILLQFFADCCLFFV